jgi:hypothetical protein
LADKAFDTQRIFHQIESISNHPYQIAAFVGERVSFDEAVELVSSSFEIEWKQDMKLEGVDHIFLSSLLNQSAPFTRFERVVSPQHVDGFIAKLLWALNKEV